MRIAILGGTGGVGASAALNILRGPDASEVVLIGRRPHMVASHAMDLALVCALDNRNTVRGGDMADIATSDVVVLTASPPASSSDLRDAALVENGKIAENLASSLPPGWPGLILVVTNPVDALVTWLHKRTGLDRRQIIGYTLNDTLRLRCAVAEQIGAHPAEVTAWVLGEHVESLVPIWNHISVNGDPVHLEPAGREAAAEFVSGWFHRHAKLNAGRSSTWTSGAGVARLVAEIARDTKEVWPASVVLNGEYGHDGVALTVPASLGRSGIEEVVEWELEPEAQRGLDRAAEVVRAGLEQLDAGTRVQQ